MRDVILAKSPVSGVPNSGDTLSEHTIACLKAVEALLDYLPLPEQEKQALQEDVLTAVATHDVGKAAIGFQKVLWGEEQNWQGKRHEVISASFASAIQNTSDAAIFAILTHHKSIPSDGISQIFGCLPWEQIYLSNKGSPVWDEMAQEWKDNIALFIIEWKKICTYLGRESLVNCQDLNPLSLDASWLERTSGKRGQRSSVEFQRRFHTSIVRGLTIAADHLGSIHKVPPAGITFSEFPILKQTPRPFQITLGSVKGPAIMRAPTGSGKTEAALLWTQNNQSVNGRLFYVLPYSASINAMCRRLERIFGSGKAGLLHHRATSSLYGMLESDNDLFSRLNKQQLAVSLAGLAREIWFPIRVCTPHQILRYTLRGKGWEYMLAEFPNACFIFDEIHAYDPRMVGLTLASAKLLSRWGAKCLFMSATLPGFIRELITQSLGDLPFIEPNPDHKDDKEILYKKRHMVEVKDGTILEHINEIIEVIHHSPSTLIVCNHVKTSQQLYRYLKKEFSGELVKLIHGRFNQEDRNNIEKQIVTKPFPKILVATQVVEVSLDIDFDQAFLEPAPVDALIQRMGRVNRFGNRPPAEVQVFSRQVHAYNIYCECHGASHELNCRIRLTLDEFQKLKNPISELDLVNAADRVYGDGYQGMSRVAFEEGINHPDIKEFESRLLAGAHQDWVESIIEKTDGVVEILPKCLLAEYDARKKKGLWVEANSLLVPVRIRSLAWLRQKIEKRDDLWIGCLDYASDEGLQM